MHNMNLAERKNLLDMRQFLTRGRELASQGQVHVDSEIQVVSGIYSYERYLLTISGLQLSLVNETTRGSFGDRIYGWSLCYRVGVAFVPKGQGNLRVKKGVEDGLAFFEVKEEESKSSGLLEFDRRLIERVNWWDRLVDSLNGLSEVTEFVDSNRGARSMLRCLNQIMVSKPTDIVPVDPDQWLETARNRAFGIIRT